MHLFQVLSVLLLAPLGGAHSVPDLRDFKNPPLFNRPVFRYWLPDASVDKAIVEQDIVDAYDVGMGGVEFLPFFEYGGQNGPMPKGANWSTYNFGTPPFVELFKASLRKHKEKGMLMDFAFGPNQGQGVPAFPDNEGLSWDMTSNTASIELDGSFDGKLPGWGSGKLVSVSTAVVLSSKNKSTISTSYLDPGATIEWTVFTLEHDSMMVHTKKVDTDSGHLKLNLPPLADGLTYQLFAFYEKLSGYKALEFDTDRHETIFDYGAYAVDHYDAKGAQVVIDFWEKYMLKDKEVSQLIAEVGRYAWEDSIEIQYNITWSNTLLSRFKTYLGYDFEPFLPLIVWDQGSTGSYQCLFDTEDQGLSYIDDYRATLVNGYVEYLTTFREWVHKTLKIELSTQPGYNLPMDTLATVPYVDAPECESLGFSDSIEYYREFTGPAFLTSKKIISNEMGAMLGRAYSYHLREFLFSFNRALVGGVNRIVMHGHPYQGDYYQTTWPGPTPFDYLFSDPWSSRQPTWDHGLKGVLDYVSRLQLVHQQGTPKVDVVVLNKQSGSPDDAYTYSSKDLNNGGWTINYLSPDNLALPQAFVKDGELAPDGPAWRAFIVESSQNVSTAALKKLTEYAESGLPIIVSGGSPSHYPSHTEPSSKEFHHQLSILMKTKNVHACATGHVAHTLKSLELKPRAGVNTEGTWYTTWRETDAVDYAMVYSDLEAAKGTVQFATTKQPYMLDPWTGELSPVSMYQLSEDAITVDLSLAGNQTAVFVFGNNLGSPPQVHAVSSSTGSGLIYEGDDVFLSFTHASDNPQVALNDGRTFELSDAEDIPQAFELSSWNLTAEHWEAPDDLHDVNGTVKRNTSQTLDKLKLWNDIPALFNVSGVGYYSTSFQWPPSSSACVHDLGATLSFSKIVDTLLVDVNGVRIPPLDIMDATADITPYLVSGENELTVTVPTTLINYLTTIIEDLKNAGVTPSILSIEDGGPEALRTDAGLLGPVNIVPYARLRLT